MKKTLLLFFSLLLFSVNRLSAQGCVNTTQYPSGTITIASTGTTNITTCNYGGEYSIENFTATGSYMIYATGGSNNFITVTNGANTIIGAGWAPLGLTVGSTGIYKIHISTNSSCGTDASCHNVYVVGTTAFCNNTTQYPSGTVTIANSGTTTVTTCNYGGEVSVNNFTSTGIYTVTASGGTGNFITIKNFANTIIYASGLSPVTFSVPFTGAYRIHLTVSGPGTCGTDASCHTVKVIGPGLPGCTGTPATPVAAISSSIGCPNGTFTLTGTGASVGTGLTYSWQASSSASGTFTNITGGNSVTYATSTPTVTFYRLITTCANSALTSTSSVISYSVNNPGPCVCTSYGASGATSTGDEEILGVSIGTMVNVSTCSSTGPGAGSTMNMYSNYAGFVNPMVACSGASVVSSVTLGTCGGWYGVGMNVYADWNQDGSFTGTGELVATFASATQGVNNFTIAIPSNALPGLTRIRVVAVEGTVPGPTGTFTWGETEDYCFIVLPPPTITAVTGSVCPGFPYVLNPVGAVSYTYAGPNSYTATGTSATVNPIANSVYSISGTGSNGCIASGASAGQVSVSLLPTPSVSAAISSSAFCYGGSSTIQLSGANTYTWVSPNSQSATIVVSPTATTVYTVASTGTVSCNGVNTFTLVVYPLPIIGTSPSTPTSCVPTPFNLSATGAVTYSWSNSTVGGTAALTPTSPTNYTLAGTSSLGCVGTLTFAINPVPVLTITPSYTTVCLGTAANFSANGASTYTWSNNSNGSTVAVTPTANTAYSVSGTNQYGCTGSAIVPVITNSLPAINVSPASVTVCANTTVVGVASGAATYTWVNGPASPSTQVSPSVTTTYTVNGTDPVNGCIGNALFVVQTNALPTLTVVKTPSALCSGQSGTLVALGAQSFTWNGTLIQNEIYTTPSVTSVYTVSGVDSLGCENSITVSYQVNPKPTLSISPAQQTICTGETITVTANGASTYSWLPVNLTGSQVALSPKVTSNYVISGVDANNCSNNTTYTLYVSKCTSLSENDVFANLKVYPNPSSGLYTVEFAKDGSKSVVVMNAVGSIVLQTVTTEDTTTIDLTSFSNGVYFVKVSNEGVVKTLRLIKE